MRAYHKGVNFLVLLLPIHPWCKSPQVRPRQDKDGFPSERINERHSLRTTSNTGSPKPAAILTPRVFTVAYHQLANAIAGTAPSSPSKFGFSFPKSERTKLPAMRGWLRLSDLRAWEYVRAKSGAWRSCCVLQSVRPQTDSRVGKFEEDGPCLCGCLHAGAPPFCFEVSATRKAPFA